MMLKIIVVATCFYFACQAFVFDSLARVDQCKNDTECGNGCCHQDLLGNRCHNYSNAQQPCLLPNHHNTLHLYPCGCMPGQGLTCKEIHFDPSLHVVNANGSDPLAQVETLLKGHGYGLCEV